MGGKACTMPCVTFSFKPFVIVSFKPVTPHKLLLIVFTRATLEMRMNEEPASTTELLNFLEFNLVEIFLTSLW
jgi:hypothetical protein